MVSEAEIKKIMEKTIPKTMYFLHAFLNRFWRSLGRVLGDVWDLLGVSWGTFKRLFSRLCCQEGPRGGQEASWAQFSMVLDRFWEGFGTSLASLGALLNLFF